MPIKELIELLQKIENQDSEVFQIIVGIYSGSVCIQYDDDKKDEIVIASNKKK